MALGLAVPAVGAALGAAGRLGYRFAPSLMNLGRRAFSPKPWKQPVMRQRSKGFGQSPVVKGTWPKGGGVKFEPVTKAMDKGWVAKAPLTTAGLAAYPAYGVGKRVLGGGEEVPEVTGTITPSTPEWAAPEDLLSFSEQARADAEKGKSDMKKMLKYGFLISAAGGSPDKFFERASEMSKMSAAYTQNERYAKQFDAVFREGDMPDSPQMAYKRLVKVGMGPKEAAEITGQVAQLTGKTETERAMNTLSQVYASQGEDAAARLLMTYWATGQLDLPEHLKYAKEEDLFEAARAYVGGAGVGAAEATGEEIGEITPG